MALSPAQIARFIDDGFVRLDDGFPREVADAGRAILWRDTGCAPDDPSTWTALGFGLGELANLLALSQQRTIRRRDVAAAGAAKLAELDQRIADLRRMRRAVAGLLALPCIDPAAPCPIIASLASLPPQQPRRRG
jgi:hypothetical protein